MCLTLSCTLLVANVHLQPQALQKAKMDKEAEMAATKAKWQQLLDEATRAHGQEKEANAALQQQLAQVGLGGAHAHGPSPSTSLLPPLHLVPRCRPAQLPALRSDWVPACP